jgi:hypothetical protein
LQQSAGAIDKTGNWIKTVRNKEMLIPTIELVQASAGKFASAEGVDAAALRKALAEQFGADGTCPVTVRRHLKALGIPARKKT